MVLCCVVLIVCLRGWEVGYRHSIGTNEYLGALMGDNGLRVFLHLGGQSKAYLERETDKRANG